MEFLLYTSFFKTKSVFYSGKTSLWLEKCTIEVPSVPSVPEVYQVLLLLISTLYVKFRVWYTGTLFYTHNFFFKNFF
jgi:hypothetical protein